MHATITSKKVAVKEENIFGWNISSLKNCESKILGETSYGLKSVGETSWYHS
jgi:hypothetical protein